MTKTVSYLFVLTIIVVFIGFLFGTMSMESMDSGSTIKPSLHEELDFYVFIGTTFTVFLTIIFFRQLDRLLGHGVLFKVFLGKYRRPQHEHRVFMFLDLKSSTSLAEQMTPDDYFSFLNDFFRDLSIPVLNAGGEIYQYVGDEVVISWKQSVGIQNLNCVRLFFAIDAAIAIRRKYYLDRYGIVPQYKAGAHAGEVITAEIGDLKKEIVYNGDVLNTTARIQSVCNELGKRFIVSKKLMQAMDMPERFLVEELGPIALRGKAESLELVGLA